jgi:hypothetical protein
MSNSYTIEFDTLPGHQPGTGATLGQDVLQPSGWRSIGDPGGGSFTNSTGGPLRAIYLKANNPGDTFTITAASAGKLFDTVWLKNDNTEVYFLDGHVPNSNTIPNLSAFWMRVPPNPDSEIQQCDSGGACPFTGQAFAVDPPDPVGPAWNKIKSGAGAANEKWARLLSASPSAFRDIRAYAEASDGRRILFVSSGNVLLYDDSTTTVSRYPDQETIFSTVNRISFEGDNFILWRSGRPIRTLPLAAANFTPIGQPSPAATRRGRTMGTASKAVPRLNSFADVQTFFNQFITNNGTDLSGSPHGDYWNGTYDAFVNGDVKGVPGVKNLIKGDADHSNLILILRGPLTIGGRTIDQMPADGSPFMTPDLIGALADWINRGCPQ